MIKISYPEHSPDLLIFENQYYETVRKVHNPKVDAHLANIHYNGAKLTFEILIKLKFDALINLSNPLRAYSKTTIKKRIVDKKEVFYSEFDELFDYSYLQPDIANFFMSQRSVKINTCFFCGIDFIYAFKDIMDYWDGLDFVNRAGLSDLMIIEGIGPVTAERIIRKRGKIGHYSDLKQVECSHLIYERLREFNISNTHNTFTLDHFLPQHSHAFYSLCLYNLVPSCYSCNAKFKQAKEFTVDSDLNFVCPTSSSYSLANDCSFRIYYKNELKEIKSEFDFLLDKDIKSNHGHIHNYFDNFKIQGRYNYLKDKVLPIIIRKVKYSDSKIVELSKRTGMSQEVLKKLIFGEELFDENQTNNPLVKFKRDVAKNILIKGVVG